MNSIDEPRVLIIDDSISELTVLVTLLSSLSKKITACSSYDQGLRILQSLKENEMAPDVVFLALPPEQHPEADDAIKLFVASLQDGQLSKTIVLGGNKLPPQVDAQTVKDESIIYKPITLDKLRKALAPLKIYLPKINCWEYTHCGREPGGRLSEEEGVCPASIFMQAEGIHAGKCGGRSCWAVSGTMCGGAVQGTFAGKMSNCQNCDFYQLVKMEENDAFESIDSVLKRIKRKTALGR